MSGNPKRRKLWLLIPVLIAAGVGVFFHFRQPAEKKQEKTASAKSPDRIYPVKRGDMTIGGKTGTAQVSAGRHRGAGRA